MGTLLVVTGQRRADDKAWQPKISGPAEHVRERLRGAFRRDMGGLALRWCRWLRMRTAPSAGFLAAAADVPRPANDRRRAARCPCERQGCMTSGRRPVGMTRRRCARPIPGQWSPRRPRRRSRQRTAPGEPMCQPEPYRAGVSAPPTSRQRRGARPAVGIVPRSVRHRSEPLPRPARGHPGPGAPAGRAPGRHRSRGNSRRRWNPVGKRAVVSTSAGEPPLSGWSDDRAAD